MAFTILNIWPFGLFLLLQFIQLIRADVIEQLTRQGSAIIADAKIIGGEIRQCTCQGE
jgi:hypothetical protein